MVPLTAQVDLSSMEIVGLIRYTQRILMRRHPNEFSKLSMFWKAEDMPLNRYSGSMYQKRLRDGVMVASRRECGIGTDRTPTPEPKPTTVVALVLLLLSSPLLVAVFVARVFCLAACSFWQKTSRNGAASISLCFACSSCRAMGRDEQRAA